MKVFIGVIMVTDDHYDFVKKQIKATYQSIQLLEFDKGCEEKDCQWCNFNSSYKKQKQYSGINLMVDDDSTMDET